MSQMISFETHQALLGAVKAQEYARGMLDMRTKLEEAGLVHPGTLANITQELLAASAKDPRDALATLAKATQLLLPLAGVPMPPVVDGALDLLIDTLHRPVTSD